MKQRLVWFVCLAMCALALPSSWLAAADAADTFVIRMATIAPDKSKAMRILRAWDLSVQEKTQGRVKFRFYPGGVEGDERDVLRKITANQLDCTSLTSVGLGQVVRSASVLQLPGMFKSSKELAAVRIAMDSEWRKSFDDSGYQLLGWFDIGFGRIFSKQKVAKPTDLKTTLPWVWGDDPVFPALLHAVGASGVKLPLPEVFTGLQTGMVNTVVASPTAALGLRWFDSVKYMTKQADIALVGATLISNKLFKGLPADAQEVLRETGKQAHAKALELIVSEEQKDYESLKTRGIEEVDTAPHAAEWQKAYDKVRADLTGKLFTKELLARVTEAAKSARK